MSFDIPRSLCFACPNAAPRLSFKNGYRNLCQQSAPSRPMRALTYHHATVYASATGPATASSVTATATDNTRLAFEEDEDEEEDETLVLRDPITGLKLEVGVEGTVEVEGEEYLVVYPVLDAITIAVMRPDGELESIEDPAELLHAARTALEEEQLHLVESAYVLTVDDDDALDMELLDEDDEDEEEIEDEENSTAEDDENAVEVLAEFAHKGSSYIVARALAATVLIARRTAEGDGFEALVGEELEHLAPHIDEQMSRWSQVNSN